MLDRGAGPALSVQQWQFIGRKGLDENDVTDENKARLTTSTTTGEHNKKREGKKKRVNKTKQKKSIDIKERRAQPRVTRANACPAGNTFPPCLRVRLFI